MIKCFDKGMWTCISRNGTPKKSYDDDKSAINAAKIVNEKNNFIPFNLQYFFCPKC